MLSSASSVIVNSQSVAADIRQFYPNAKAAVFALPFGPAPAPEWFSVDAEFVRKKYAVSDAYFIICNQFWKHKDHLTAFHAFAEVAKESPQLSLICTGQTGDYRDPAYFPMLMQTVDALGLTGRVRVLGLIPKSDQIALLRGAIAVVQPTLFEGGPGGGAVYDAVSLGVPSLVSDIAVNREVNEPHVAFFQVGDAVSLAATMKTALNSPRPFLSPEVLMRKGHARRAACGAMLLRAIEVAGSGRRHSCATGV